MSKIIKGFKAFNKDMKCKGFQYKEGETYKTGNARICNMGFHFCTNPLPEKNNKDTNKDYAKLASSGNSAKLASSGDSAKLALDGQDSIGATIGANSKIKGKKGNWITLSEWKYNDKKNRYVPVCVKSAQIDGKKLKEDVWCKLKDKKIVEAT